jgi:thiamine-monophosphate kinase
MGAVPTALVVALAAPASIAVSFLEEFADGLRDGCAALAPGCGIVGGDLSVSGVLTIAVTAFGDLEGRHPVLRSGARAGDVVAVSGILGAAAEGIRILFGSATTNGVPDGARVASLRAQHPEIAAQLAPRPPIGDGRLAALAGATAMMDISDGLVLDARRMAVASGVALDLSATAVGSERALVGGEDHSLLACFPSDVVLPGGFREVGRVVAGSGVLIDGVEYSDRGGWDPYDSWDGKLG